MVALDVRFHILLPHNVLWQKFKVTEYASTNTKISSRFTWAIFVRGDGAQDLRLVRRELKAGTIRASE